MRTFVMPPFEGSESDKEKELEKLHAPAESTDINKKVVTYSGWKSLIWRWKDHIPYAILTVSLVEVQLGEGAFNFFPKRKKQSGRWKEILNALVFMIVEYF